MDGPMDGAMDRRMDGPMGGPMDGAMDRPHCRERSSNDGPARDAKVILVLNYGPAQRPKFFTESYNSNDGSAQRPKFFIVVIITFLKIII